MTAIEEPGFSAIVLVARVCLSAVFLHSAIHKALWYSKAIDEFKEASVPLIPIALPLTIALQLIASVCILGGVFVSEAALALAVFTVFVTTWVHRFWQTRGSLRLEQIRNALANLGLVGGLLLLAASGPEQYSFL